MHYSGLSLIFLEFIALTPKFGLNEKVLPGELFFDRFV